MPTERVNPFASALSDLEELRDLVDAVLVKAARLHVDRTVGRGLSLADPPPAALAGKCLQALRLFDSLCRLCGLNTLGRALADVFESLRPRWGAEKEALSVARVLEFRKKMRSYIRLSSSGWTPAEGWLRAADEAAGPWSGSDVDEFSVWRDGLLVCSGETWMRVMSAVATSDRRSAQTAYESAAEMHRMALAHVRLGGSSSGASDRLVFGASSFRIDAVHPGCVQYALRTAVPVVYSLADRMRHDPGAVDTAAVQFADRVHARLLSLSAVMRRYQEACPPDAPGRCLTFAGLGLREPPEVFFDSAVSLPDAVEHSEAIGPSQWQVSALLAPLPG